MERLTKRIREENRVVYAKATDEIEGVFSEKRRKQKIAYEVLCRLAELEDKLESGQLVDMKCKIGDTVFFDTFTNNGSTSIGIQEHEVKWYELNLVVNNTQGYDVTRIPINEIGKSVFLDKAEAEQKISKN